ncbi:MAG: hypothetical protein BGN88_03335 [Clostridiales bacterium 43-6]|nr:MAG: hypothetical protein BGN88_03335 [Clostridiales bacterium 43-6]
MFFYIRLDIIGKETSINNPQFFFDDFNLSIQFGNFVLQMLFLCFIITFRLVYGIIIIISKFLVSESFAGYVV